MGSGEGQWTIAGTLNLIPHPQIPSQALDFTRFPDLCGGTSMETKPTARPLAPSRILPPRSLLRSGSQVVCGRYRLATVAERLAPTPGAERPGRCLLLGRTISAASFSNASTSLPSRSRHRPFGTSSRLTEPKRILRSFITGDPTDSNIRRTMRFRPS